MCRTTPTDCKKTNISDDFKQDMNSFAFREDANAKIYKT